MASLKALIVACFPSFIFVSCYGGTVSSRFSKDRVLCDVMERVDRGCSDVKPFVRSRIHCFMQCSLDKSCIGASEDQNGQCFHHKECSFTSECMKKNEQHLYMTKHCAHGTWNELSQSCECVGGTFGERCNQFPKKCKDLISMGYEDGFHRVYLDPDHDGQKPFLAVCYIQTLDDYSAVHVIRNEGTKDFNKTFVEYVNGFVYDDHNLWLGLYPLYRLTHAGLNKMVSAFWFMSRNGARVFREYNYVYVHPETEGYSVSFASTARSRIGNVPKGAFFGDCLGSLQYLSFSTWDKDRDGDNDENCAANAGSGWWYDKCDNPCNVLGYDLRDLGSRPRQEMMSLLGVDLDAIHTEQFRVISYFVEPDTNV